MTANKIHAVNKLGELVAKEKQAGKKVIHCHGVFDLIHIGHIKHLEAAKKLGDVLVVTTTPDRFVNKGPHRPAFGEQLRAEALAALSCVDYVAINEWPTAVEIIKVVKPDLFVKGFVKEEGKRDHTNAINEEEEAVVSAGGKLHLTEEETFSATTLINRFTSIFSPQTREFLEKFRSTVSPESLIAELEKLKGLKVLVVGETILDDYQFCNVLGKSSKEPVLAALLKKSEYYLGGSLAIANHVANFCEQVTVVTGIGAEKDKEELIQGGLKSNIQPHLLKTIGHPTIVKRRFLEGYLGTKIFEVYEMGQGPQSSEFENEFRKTLEREIQKHDVVIVADYGHGLISKDSVRLLCTKSKFLAVNSQVNAGNRGFNLLSKYPRADFVSIGEPELRLDARDLEGPVAALISQNANRMCTKYFISTAGSSGLFCCDDAGKIHQVPAFSIKVVDRVGAGDAVLAITAPAATLGLSGEVLGFIANVVGAEACMIMGHSSSISSSSLYRSITSLLK